MFVIVTPASWLERNSLHLKTEPALAELSYLLPRETEVIGTFNEVAAVLAESGGRCRIAEASDSDGLLAYRDLDRKWGLRG